MLPSGCIGGVGSEGLPHEGSHGLEFSGLPGAVGHWGSLAFPGSPSAADWPSDTDTVLIFSESSPLASIAFVDKSLGNGIMLRSF